MAVGDRHALLLDDGMEVPEMRFFPTRKMLATGYTADKIAKLYFNKRWSLVREGYIVELS